MSANSKETAAAILALSNALGNHHVSMKVPSAPPADDSDSANSSSNNSDDLQLHEWELGRDEILRRAEAGDLSCKFLVGMGYSKGHFGFPYDLKQANRWLLDAKTYKNNVYQNDIAFRSTAEGYCQQYALADVKEKNLEKAMPEYNLGSRKYIPATFLNAAARYEAKQFDKPGYDKLCARLRATAGFTGSIMEYSEYRSGFINNIMKDIKDCVDAGFTPAYIFLARRHWDGWKDFGEGYGGDDYKNAPEALRLLQEAEKAGDSPARLSLSQAYCYGSHGTEKNIPEAQRLLELAVRDNIPAASGCLELLFKEITSTALPTTSTSTTKTTIIPTVLTAVAPPPPVILSKAAINNNNAPIMPNKKKQKKKQGGTCTVS